MIAVYAHYYDGPPAPDLSWQMFWALVRNASKMEARHHLTSYDSALAAIGHAFSGGGEATRHRDQLKRAAFPLVRKGPKFLENRFLTEGPRDRNGR